MYDSSGADAMIGLMQFLVGAGVYVWVSLALMAVFRKTGSQLWMAWIPVVREWELFKLAGMKPYWSIIIYAAGFVVGTVQAVVLIVSLGAAITGGLAGNGSAVGAGVAGILLVVLMWVALGVFVLILGIKMLLGLCRGFGLGAGYVVLGVLLFPVWASVVGWGTAMWRGPASQTMPQMAAPGGASPFPANRPPQAYQPYQPQQPGAFPPAAPQQPVYGAPPAQPPAPPVIPGPPVPPSPAAPSGWAPPAPPVSPAPPVYAAPETSLSAPAIPVQPAAPGVPSQQPEAPQVEDPVADSTLLNLVLQPSPEEEDVDDRTVLATRHRPAYQLTLPGGQTVLLTEETVLLGRSPEAGAESAQLIDVHEETRTISKTHAKLVRSGNEWTIIDMDSTNGVFLVDETGAETEVQGSAPVHGAFMLGDAAFVLAVGDERAR